MAPKNYAAPSGYTFRETDLYGLVDVLDFTGTVLAHGVPLGEARCLVDSWQSGASNPYVTKLGLTGKRRQAKLDTP